MARWDHNSHYHRYLLNQLPSTIARALDIGCGYGEFAAHLAQRAAQVDVIDVSQWACHGNEPLLLYRGANAIKYYRIFVYL